MLNGTKEKPSETANPWAQNVAKTEAGSESFSRESLPQKIGISEEGPDLILLTVRRLRPVLSVWADEQDPPSTRWIQQPPLLALTPGSRGVPREHNFTLLHAVSKKQSPDRWQQRASKCNLMSGFDHWDAQAAERLGSGNSRRVQA